MVPLSLKDTTKRVSRVQIGFKSLEKYSVMEMSPAAAPILPNALCTHLRLLFLKYPSSPPRLLPNWRPMFIMGNKSVEHVWTRVEEEEELDLPCSNMTSSYFLQPIEVTTYMGKLVTQSLRVPRNSFIIDEILISCNWLFWTRVVGSLGLPIKSWTIAEHYRRTFPLVGKGGGWLQRADNWHTLFIFSYIKVLDLPVPSH